MTVKIPNRSELGAFSEKYIQKIYLGTAVLGWLGLLAFNFNYLDESKSPPHMMLDVRALCLTVSIVGLFLFYKRYFRVNDSLGVSDLLQRIFNVGLVAVAVALLNRVLISFFSSSDMETSMGPVVPNLSYHLVVGATLVFVLHTFSAFRNLVLYHRTKTLVNLWHIFEYGALITLLLNLFGFNIFRFPNIILLAIFMGVALFLAFNVKWVPYLDFKQKLQAALMLGSILVFSLYLVKEFYDLSNNGDLTYQVVDNVFIIIVFTFNLLYSLTALLVALFNLPTSSVYDQRAEEINNFQRLSRGMTYSEDESRVYDVLMDACVGVTQAPSGWILTNDRQNEGQIFVSKEVTKKTADEIVRSLLGGISLQQRKKLYHRNLNIKKLIANFKDYSFRSILIVPLLREKKKIGILVLCKDVVDGFDKESINLIRSYVAQANITMQNFRLIGHALENERYQEELNIAKKVQNSLLPAKLESNDDFGLTVFSQAADSVGGDYYDIFNISDSRYAIGVGDVSGKGTSAAFNMAQLKGVFQSLAQLDLPSGKFMELANSALGRCLEKASFITMIYLVIDTADKTVEFTRAGHCPMLLLPHDGKEPEFLETKGLGLGILRSGDFSSYLETKTIPYHPGDALLLFTDGIIEAKNAEGEEYGTERVRELAKNHHKKHSSRLIKSLIKDVHNFCPGGDLNDDYTAMLIKFELLKQPQNL